MFRLLLLVCTAVALPPNCFITTQIDHVLRDWTSFARLETRVTVVRGVRVGVGHRLSRSEVQESSDPGLVMPTRWYRSSYPVDGAEAYSGCKPRTLTSVELNENIAEPVLTFGSILELSGGKMSWDARTGVVAVEEYADTHFDLYSEKTAGVARASCPMFECQFQGTMLESENIRVAFRPPEPALALSCLFTSC